MDEKCCSYCDYKSIKTFNLTRHMQTMHSSKNVIQPSKNVIQTSKNVIQTSKNVIHSEDNPLQCNKCLHIYKKKSYLAIHYEKCKGQINKLQCNYCDKVFKYISGKSKHMKTCEAKEKITTLVKSNSQEIVQIANQNIDLQQNITTQNNYNLVVFNITDDIFMKDHITNTVLTKILQAPNNMSIVRNYSKKLLERKENQCIKKSNLSSSHSKVHIGNNSWETRPDKEIYPDMMCCIASGFSDLICQEKKRKTHKQLDAFLDYMADSGYINDTDEKQKEMKDKFRLLVNDLKFIIFDIHRNK
jgi:hypothetical protein